MDNLFDSYNETNTNNDFEVPSVAKILVIGVGGGGNNAINRMAEAELGDDVVLVGANTDYQALNNCFCQVTLELGKNTTRGLGAGGNPEIGEQAAIDSKTDIRNLVKDANMVFIAAGMGGGTGTGAAPVIAQICKEVGALTIGIVTRPFTFEGKTRNANAAKGLENLRPYCDSLIVISNDQLLSQLGNESFKKAFSTCDDILCHSVKIITDLILKPALINLDFNDVKAVMENKGTALIGMGVGKGDNKAVEAAKAAIQSPLLELSIKGAKNGIVFISGGESMTPLDFHQAVDIIKKASNNPDINLIFGVREDDSLGDSMQVTVIATDFENDEISLVDEDEIPGEDFGNIDIGDVSEKETNNEEPIVEETLEDIIEEAEVKSKRSFLPNFLKRRKK